MSKRAPDSRCSSLITHHYCPNVDWLIVYILLDLIDLTPIHVGIDFNSMPRHHAVLVRADQLECVVGRLFGKIAIRNQDLATMSHTFTSVITVMVFEKA